MFHLLCGSFRLLLAHTPISKSEATKRLKQGITDPYPTQAHFHDVWQQLYRAKRVPASEFILVSAKENRMQNKSVAGVNLDPELT